jgi:predicted transporter
MTYQDDFTIPAEIMEQIAAERMDASVRLFVLYSVPCGDCPICLTTYNVCLRPVNTNVGLGRGTNQ